MGYNIVILGSTGTIGIRTLDVIDNLDESYKIIGLAGGKNHQLLTQQAKRTKCRFASISNEEDFNEFSAYLPANCQPLLGEQGMLEMISDPNVDFILCGIVGIVALIPILTAIKMGKTVAFANKEILVMAGEIITQQAKKSGATILPIDSEHNAIFQCLLGHKKEDISQIILSCSGGPFCNFTTKQLRQVTLKQALKHPTWKMGNKITIDSATLMNKALEIIEAHWLFQLPSEKINAIIHPQSIIHSLVEYRDGSIIAQLGVTDMAIPIQYALTYPYHLDALPNTKLDWTEKHNLQFFPPDLTTFPSITMAKQALKAGGTFPVALNAANEIAVEAFLQKQISFLKIWEVINEIINKHTNDTNKSLQTILHADQQTRIDAKELIKKNKTSF